MLGTQQPRLPAPHRPSLVPAPMPFGSHTIEVAEANAPALGTLVTLTFALQA